MRYLPLSLPLLLIGTVVTPLDAQWRVALLVAHATAHGDARDESDPEHPEFHADRPSSWAVAFAHTAGAWRAGIEVRRTTADLSEVSTGSVVSTPGALGAWGIGAELGRRILGHPSAATLHAVLGIGIDRWAFDLAEESSRWRVSGRGAIEADLPISRSWSVVMRGEAAAGPSVFKRNELPEGFTPRTMWRSGISIGMARAL